MEKVIKILSVVNRVFITLILIITVLLSTSVAYIIFAPDNFPKPFYLSYLVPTPEEVAAAEAPAEPTPLPVLDVKQGEGVMVDTGAKIINLVDSTGHKYIRASIVLEFAPTSEAYNSTNEEEKAAFMAEFNNEMNARIPIINDIIITLLSTKSYEDLYTAEGKELVRKQIMDEINLRMPEHHVIAVYFTEFVIE